jgi:hypothetical protein
MAVKLDNIDALQEANSVLKNYSNGIASATTDVNSKFQAKIDNQKAEALNQYIDIMNDLSSQVFVQFPNQVALFAYTLNAYHGHITSEGFKSKVRSSKPGVDEDYCKKLNDTQIDSVKDSVDEIKKIIDQIATDSDVSAEISVDGASSTIDQAVQTFEENLVAEITNIKGTRSRLQEANTEFINKLNEITGKMNECEAAINRVVTLTDGTSGLSPKTAIELIIKGYFTSDNIEGYLNSVEKKGDVKGIEYLAKGDYKSFFNMNPDDLSDGVYTVVAKQIADVTTIPSNKGDLTELEEILNILLEYGGKGHAQRLSVANEVMVRQTVSLLLGMDKNDEAYKQLEQDFKKYGSLSHLFTALDALTDPKNSKIHHGGGPTVGQTDWFAITELSFSNKGSVAFQLNTVISFTDRLGKTSTDKHDIGNVGISKDGILSSDLAGFAEEYQKKQKQKEKAISDFIGNSLATGVGIFSPGLGTGIKIINDIAQGNYSNLKDKGVNGIASNFDNYGDYFKNVNDILNNMNKLQKDLDKLNEVEKKAMRDFKDVLLGVDKVVINQQKGETVVVPGIPNVQNINSFNELESNGLKNYLGESLAKLESLYKKEPPKNKFNESQNYLLGRSDKTFNDLNPKELYDALDFLWQIEPKETYSISDLAKWLQKIN